VRTFISLAIVVALSSERGAAQTSARDSASRAPRFADTLATLSAVGRTTCITTTSGAAYCWGGVLREDAAPGRVVGFDGQPARLRSLAAGARCGLTSGGDVWCDRDVTGGWIDSSGRDEPVPPACRRSRHCIGPLPNRGALPNARLRQVVGGNSHACALTPNGLASCWGQNDRGSLGIGTVNPDSATVGGELIRTPTRVVGGLHFSTIAVHDAPTCAITSTEHDVYCWGYVVDGEPTDSAMASYCAPRKDRSSGACTIAAPLRILPESLPGSFVQPNDVKFTSVSTGLGLACALSAAGEAYCWGTNYRCELGRCRSADSQRAHRIAVPGRVVEVAAGYWHACARTTQHRIFCWGDNSQGQLGSLATVNAGPDGLPPDYRDSRSQPTATAAANDVCFNGGRCSPAPVEVSSDHRWAALALGTNHACALAEDDGGIYCWGGSDSLSLGPDARLTRCENRSAVWPDTRCQPTPVRVPGLPALAPRVAAEPRRSTIARTPFGAPNDPNAARITVSRTLMRVEFAPDTSGFWGWSVRNDPGYRPLYSWSVLVEGMDGPQTISLTVQRQEPGAAEFTTLDSLVKRGKASFCPARPMRVTCTPVPASVERGRVILELRDSSAIARMFGLRPAAVSVRRERPDEGYAYLGDSVGVEYVAPEIPLPNADTREDARRSRRAFEASITTIGRTITGGTPDSGPLWLTLGDSATLTVDETWCHYDSCGGTTFNAATTWSIDDSSVVRLRSGSAAAPDAFPRTRPVVVTARRLGRTTVRANLAPSPSDTMPSSRPPSRRLERAIHVAPPVGRVELVPPPDSIHSGESHRIEVRVFDLTGRLIRGAPVEGRLGSEFASTADSTGRLLFYFGSAGTKTIVASFGGKADTLQLVVAPRR
jgi:alpha-tubulin suppressor-like RCC1 family protein